MADRDNLSQEKRNILEQFVEITGWTSGDESAIDALDYSSWNIERAVSRHFDGSGIATTSSAQPSQATTNENEIHDRGGPDFSSDSTGYQPRRQPRESLYYQNLFEEMDNVPKLLPAPHVDLRKPHSFFARQRGRGMHKGVGIGFWSILRALLLLPFTLTFRLSNGLYWFFTRIFPFLPRAPRLFLQQQQQERQIEGAQQEESNDPTENSIKFIQKFNELTEDNVKVDFYPGGYNDALRLAKNNLTWLLVILQDGSNPHSQELVQSCVNNDEFATFLNEHDITLWGGDVDDTDEAYQVASGLRSARYPFISLIAHISSSSSLHPKMSVVVRIQLQSNRATTARLIAKLESKIEKYEPQLITQRIDKQEQEFSRQIREQQDSAYEVSLALDREREQKKREDEEKRQLEEDERHQEELEEQRQQQLREQYLRWKTHLIFSDNYGKFTSEKRAKISIKFGDGERVLREFDPEDTLEDVFIFIECYRFKREHQDDDSDDEEEDEEEDIVEPVGYEHNFTFDLISPFPRQKLKPEATMIKDVKCLWPNGSLLVEDQVELVSSSDEDYSSDEEETEFNEKSGILA